jgi:ribosomal protein S18 acetylase RimI-like enzyme
VRHHAPAARPVEAAPKKGAAAMTHAVRILGPADAPAFRAVRLEALRLHPEAFGASFEEEAARDDAAFAARLAPPPPGAVFGAFDGAGAALLGTAGLHVDRALKSRHKGLVWGVHVRPEARGRGLGAALLAAVVAHARAAGLERLHLAVGTGNAPARALYDAAGFVSWGVEREALRLGPGRTVDEEHRVLELGASTVG